MSNVNNLRIAVVDAAILRALAELVEKEGEPISHELRILMHSEVRARCCHAAVLGTFDVPSTHAFPGTRQPND